MERDYFYDKNMHGVNWPDMWDRWAAYLPHVRHRADLTLIVQELIGELACGHQYTGGGDLPDAPEGVSVGLLGADFESVDGRFRIAKIYRCPFHPKGRAKYRKESVFRKPAPGMFKMAQQEFDLNLSRCWMIGHTTTDILAGSRAGMGTILVETGEGGRDGQFHVEPHFQEPTIRGAVARITSFEHALRS